MGNGGSWSVYWYNGVMVSSEIARGLDIFELVPSAHLSENEIEAARTVVLDEFNAQGQPRIHWPPSFARVRAHLDQLERSGGLSPARLAALRTAVTAAEGQAGASRAQALRSLAGEVRGEASGSSDGRTVGLLVEALDALAGG
jgi:hypothetical protein